MNRPQAVFLLLTLVSGYYLYPFRAEAKTEPLVFDRTINTIPYGPFRPSDYTPPKPRARNKASNTQAVGEVPLRYSRCSCVSWAKYKTGFTKSIGAARNWPVNSDQPTIGAVIVTYESALGHVGIVSHWDASYVYLESEANYSQCQMTYGRKIPINSPLIKGYWLNK